MDKTRWREIQAIILFAIAILIFISLATFSFSDLGLFTSSPNYPIRNFAGLFGAYLGTSLLFIMGLSAYIIPLLFLSWAMARFSGLVPQKLYLKVFGTFFLILASSAIFSIIGKGPSASLGASDNAFRFRLGGIVGLAFSDFLIKYLGRGGAILVIAVLFLLSILLATEFLLLPFLSDIFKRMKSAVKARRDDGQKEASLYTVKKAEGPQVKIKRELEEPRARPTTLPSKA